MSGFISGLPVLDRLSSIKREAAVVLRFEIPV